MKFKFFIVSILTILIFNACNLLNKHPGFKRISGDIYYKLIKIGEQENKAQIGDYITIDIKYKTLKDSVFFSGIRKLKVTEPPFKGSIENCFLVLAKDDHAEFIISADEFFMQTLEASLPRFIEPGSKMKVDISMVDIQTKKQFEKEKEAFLNWIDDFGNYEKTLLKQFIEEEKIDVPATKTGMYFITMVKGDQSKKVELGDTITVHYEGKFLNGKFFDSTIKRKEPFSFVYGHQWQVIKGLEEAIGEMHEGEKSIVILPSELAFGKSGSSTGIIPPMTSVIFEVELIEVKKKNDS